MSQLTMPALAGLEFDSAFIHGLRPRLFNAAPAALNYEPPLTRMVLTPLGLSADESAPSNMGTRFVRRFYDRLNRIAFLKQVERSGWLGNCTTAAESYAL